MKRRGCHTPSKICNRRGEREGRGRARARARGRARGRVARGERGGGHFGSVFNCFMCRTVLYALRYVCMVSKAEFPSHLVPSCVRGSICWSRLSCPRWPVLDRVRDRGRNEDTHGVFRSFICNLKKITAGYTSGRAGSSTRMRGATGSATWRAPRRPSPRRRAWRSDHRPRSSRTLVARGGCCTWRTWRACLGGRGRMSAQPHPKGEVSSRLDRGTWAFLVRIAATHKPPRHARRSHSRRRAKRAADARPR